MLDKTEQFNNFEKRFPAHNVNQSTGAGMRSRRLHAGRRCFTRPCAFHSGHTAAKVTVCLCARELVEKAFPLVIEHHTLKDLVHSDLERAQKMLRALGSIDAQFRIATPEGDYWIEIPLSDQRTRRIKLIKKFMAWKMAPAFSMAGELVNPDGVFCFGVMYREAVCAISAIEGRNPFRFSPAEWPDPSAVGEEMLALLPRGAITLTADDVAELNEYFGPNGQFPAVALRQPQV
jgi:hypothetical protein